MDKEIRFAVLSCGSEDGKRYQSQLCLALSDGEGMGICMGKPAETQEQADDNAIIELGKILQTAAGY